MGSLTDPAAGKVAFAEDRGIDRMAWWLAIAGAAASIVLGTMVVAWPGATLLVGAMLFGVWLLIHGIIHVVNAVTATAVDAAVRALTGVLGILFIVGGVVCLRNVLVSLLAVATVIGATWLIGGIVGLVSALSGQHNDATRWVVVALGVAMVLGGLVVLLWPGPSLATIVYLSGIWLIVIGAVQLVLVLRTRRAAA